MCILHKTQLYILIKYKTNVGWLFEKVNLLESGAYKCLHQFTADRHNESTFMKY